MAVLVRRYEGFHHLSVHEITVELVQFVEPELKARGVGIATKISKVLQGDETFVEDSSLKGRVLDDLSKHTGLRYIPTFWRAP